MLEVQNEISKSKNDSYVGSVQKVLVEGESKTSSDTLTGRTEGGKVVNFSGDKASVGQMVNVKITESRTWSLLGEIVK